MAHIDDTIMELNAALKQSGQFLDADTITELRTRLAHPIVQEQLDNGQLTVQQIISEVHDGVSAVEEDVAAQQRDDEPRDEYIMRRINESKRDKGEPPLTVEEIDNIIARLAPPVKINKAEVEAKMGAVDPSFFAAKPPPEAVQGAVPQQPAAPPQGPPPPQPQAL